MIDSHVKIWHGNFIKVINLCISLLSAIIESTHFFTKNIFITHFYSITFCYWSNGKIFILTMWHYMCDIILHFTKKRWLKSIIFDKYLWKAPLPSAFMIKQENSDCSCKTVYLTNWRLINSKGFHLTNGIKFWHFR